MLADYLYIDGHILYNVIDFNYTAHTRPKIFLEYCNRCRYTIEFRTGIP